MLSVGRLLQAPMQHNFYKPCCPSSVCNATVISVMMGLSLYIRQRELEV